MRQIGLGDHEEAGRVLVEPVHDPGPLHPADPGQALAAMSDQRIHERSALVTGGRVDDEARRLVDHDEVRILVHDRKRHRLACGLGRSRRREVKPGPRPGRDPLARVAGGCAVEGDAAIADERL